MSFRPVRPVAVPLPAARRVPPSSPSRASGSGSSARRAGGPSRAPRRLAVGLALAALGAAAVVPSTAAAAGFAAPVPRSPVKGAVDMPSAAVAANGRTAVLWRRFGERPRDFAYVAAIGPSAARLGRPAVVRAGSRAAGHVVDATLLALPNGGFAACFGDDPRRGETVVGCAFAAPHGGFGPLRVVARAPWKRHPAFAAAVRPDGRLALVVSRRLGRDDRMSLRSATMDARGRITQDRALATVRTNAPYDVATTTDGTVAVAWSTGPGGSFIGDRTPVLRLMAPGADRFGPPVAFTAEAKIDGGVGLRGGTSLLVSYRTGTSGGGGGGAEEIVRRLPDGSFGPPLRLPRPAAGFVEGAVVPLADGTPFAVSSAQDGDPYSDCGNVTRGVVGSGPLVAEDDGPTTQRLSARGQIAGFPEAAVLGDGGVVAAWQDALDGSGASRLEVAVRPAGATGFGPAQVLPGIAARDVAVAAGGHEAVLAWVVGSLPDGPSHVVTSALRQTPPYGPQAPRPRHPVAPCD